MLTEGARPPPGSASSTPPGSGRRSPRRSTSIRLACGLTPQEVHRNDRFVQFALVAADEAVADSGLDLQSRGKESITTGSP
ncbi:hypothetical protein Q0F99_17945 [Rathayibacter oskolensis]|nr:hypothetical protein [Rathayibacter oskolensis]WKK71309.1 hypothetical protein Q0F99_17945 [Rathayibacter oskolensis]